MYGKVFSIVIALSLLAGCSGVKTYYSKDEAAQVLGKMGGGTPRIYLYSSTKTREAITCSVGDTIVGSVYSGEYVLLPVKEGSHSILCSNAISDGGSLLLGAVSLAKGGSVHGKITVPVSGRDTYVNVKNGFTIFSDLLLESSENPPPDFSSYDLSITCTACPKVIVAQPVK